MIANLDVGFGLGWLEQLLLPARNMHGWTHASRTIVYEYPTTFDTRTFICSESFPQIRISLHRITTFHTTPRQTARHDYTALNHKCHIIIHTSLRAL